MISVSLRLAANALAAFTALSSMIVSNVARSQSIECVYLSMRPDSTISMKPFGLRDRMSNAVRVWSTRSG